MFSEKSIKNLKSAVAQGKVAQGPIDLQILPTTRCNAKCVFCPTSAVSDPVKKEMAPRWLAGETEINPGMMDRLFDDLYRLGGLRRVHITGGEPLLFTKVIPMLFILRRSFPEIEISLVTNGILLEKFAKHLAASGIDRLSISVNAADRQSYARQTQVAETSFDKVRAGIKLVREARDSKADKKPYLSVTAVLTRENFREVEKMLEFGADAGADAVTYLALMDFPFAEDAGLGLGLSEKEFAGFIAEIDRLQPLAQKKNIYLGYTGKVADCGKLRTGDIYKRVKCYAGYTFVMVWPDGTVRPCCNCETVLGNLCEQSFYSIWHSGRAQQVRERMRQITELGPPELCDCAECGYLFENREFHRLVNK